MFHFMATNRVLSLAFALLLVVSTCFASRGLLIVEFEANYGPDHGVFASFGGQGIGCGGSAHGGMYGGCPLWCKRRARNKHGGATSDGNIDGNNGYSHWDEHGIGFNRRCHGDHYGSGGYDGGGGDDGFDGYGAHWTLGRGADGEHHSGCNGGSGGRGGEHGGSYYSGSRSYDTEGALGGGSWMRYLFSYGSNGDGGAGDSKSYGVRDNHNGPSGGNASYGGENV